MFNEKMYENGNIFSNEDGNPFSTMFSKSEKPGDFAFCQKSCCQSTNNQVCVLVQTTTVVIVPDSKSGDNQESGISFEELGNDFCESIGEKKVLKGPGLNDGEQVDDSYAVTLSEIDENFLSICEQTEDEDWVREQLEIATEIHEVQKYLEKYTNEIAESYELTCLACERQKKEEHYFCRDCYLAAEWESKEKCISLEEACENVIEWFDDGKIGLPKENLPGGTPCKFGDKCIYHKKGENCGRSHRVVLTRINNGVREWVTVNEWTSREWLYWYGPDSINENTRKPYGAFGWVRVQELIPWK